MSVTDYSKGDKALWKAGRDAECDRIIALLNDAKRGLIFGPDVALVNNMIALIKGKVAERRQTQMSEYGDEGENE